MTQKDSLELMNGDRIRRTLKRMAHQIIEKNRHQKEICMFGIKDRGYAVARQLSEYLQSLSSCSVQLFPLSVNVQNGNDDEKKPSTLDGCYVLVVDDVIFTGTTMYNALVELNKDFQPDEIHTATLIDRGNRKFPIIAEFAGMELPTKLDEHVAVNVQDNVLKEVVLSPSFH